MTGKVILGGIFSDQTQSQEYLLSPSAHLCTETEHLTDINFTQDWKVTGRDQQVGLTVKL